MTRNYIGVDISKDWLDIHDPERGEQRIDNLAGAIAAWLGGLSGEDFLVMEATSRCDSALRAAAEAAGIAFARINPLHGWHYAQSRNLAKTDRVDAWMLADFGARQQPEPTPPADPARVGLGQLAQRRDQLVRMQVQEKNRLDEVDQKAVRQDIHAMLRSIARRIARIEAAIAEHLEAHPALGRDVELLCTIPCIKPVTAVELLAHMPELGQLDRRAIAKLGGLAPRAKDSGRRKGRRHLFPGRRHIRGALFMPALAGLRHPHLFNGFGARLKARNKAGRVIVIALARKILTVANAIMKSRKPYAAPCNTI